MTGELRRILIINLGGIGDLILSSGALAALRRSYPGAQMDLLAAGRCAPLMNAYRLFDTVYPVDISRPLSALPLLLRLRRLSYDLAVNMRSIASRSGAIKLRLLLSLIGAKTSAGRNTDGRGRFLDISVPESLADGQPEHSYDLALAKTLGAATADAAIFLPSEPRDRVFVEDLLAPCAITGDDQVVIVHPGGHPSHRWPWQNFVLLIHLLLREFGCKVLLTGSSDEVELCRTIARETADARVFILAGKLSVIHLAALFRRSDLIVANDTGVMHVAVAAGLPGVFLFGPGYVKRFSPFRQPERYVVLHKPAACSPCERMTCGDLSCLKNISVQDAFNAVLQLKGKTP